MKVNRRDFLKKTGLVAGGTLLTGSIAHGATKSSFDATQLDSQEQVNLLTRFENWVNNYSEIVKKETIENREFKNNKALTELPDQLANWMPELKKHFADPQFAAQYLKVSEKLTQAVTPQF
ncbi:MAG: twin-arginine translocation signal domain-containing protein [Bacteroidales bacterium]|nr:twin-arginine translocation signal domain-containing protein [Bacteroidales bacterium]